MTKLTHFYSICHSLDCHYPLYLFYHIHCLPSHFAFFLHFGLFHGSRKRVYSQRWIFTKRSLNLILWWFGPFAFKNKVFFFFYSIEMSLKLTYQIPVLCISHFWYFEHLIYDKNTSKLIFLISSWTSPYWNLLKLVLKSWGVLGWLIILCWLMVFGW